MWHPKEEPKTGKSDRKKLRELVVIHLLLSRLPERKRATCHIAHHESA